MRRFFIRGGMLLCLFLVIDKPIAWKISQWAQNRQYDNRLAILGKGEIRADVLILGSSRALNDLDAGTLENLSGKRVYNLGFSGSNHAFHLSVLRLALASNKPQSIILVIDQGTSFMPDERSLYRTDLLFPFSAYPAVYRQIADHTDKIFWLGEICWMYRENNNLIPALQYLKNGKLAPDETSDIDEYGSVMLEGHAPGFDTSMKSHEEIPYLREEESKELLESFHEILAICRKEGIALYLVQPPHLFKNYSAFNFRLKELVKNRAEVVDLSSYHLEKAFYFDAGHLNKQGAVKFTTALYNRIADGL